MAGSSLPEKVAQIYYSYGLFCSSYPLAAVALAFTVVLLCCYPLLNMPLPGNIPTQIQIPLPSQASNFDSNNEGCNATDCFQDDDDSIHLDYILNETQKLPYAWAKDKPYLFYHQIILKTGVSPWNSNLKMWDAFRAPLQEVFRLLETIRNHEDPETRSSLASQCLQVDSVRRRDGSAEPVLPEYSCLLLSPANLWHQNMDEFALDANILSTIYSHQSVRKGRVSPAEMAFGLQLRDSGVKRYPVRARARLLHYAVTIVYQQPSEGFINSMIRELKRQYPLHARTRYSHARDATIVYYPGEFNYRELVPLAITFVVLFLYVYFSLRKISNIRSKLGLAASATLTVAASLATSMGVCHQFGFALSLHGKEVFPYLVGLVGLENVLVLTKSVTTTDARLDAKIRLAQGLSKEGWSITKNLLTEITIFTFSFFTFVPFIQEFSIFMIVSLISDYLVQMLLFTPVLGMSVRGAELPEQPSKLHLNEYFSADYVPRRPDDEWESPQRMTKSKSHPRLTALGCGPAGVAVGGAAGGGAGSVGGGVAGGAVPKRLRLVNLWARTRFFQRAFMLWMVVWMSCVVYRSGVVEWAAGRDEGRPRGGGRGAAGGRAPPPFPAPPPAAAAPAAAATFKHSPHHRPWTRLSPHHWSSLISQYNSSVGGRMVVGLPPTLLSHRVPPEVAVRLRNPDEREPPPLRWQALAAALDPIDIIHDYESAESGGGQWAKAAELPIYPTTPMEILLLAILCSISVAVIAYTMVVLYRCVCSRNYAEWRASWTEKEDYKKMIAKQPAVQLVMEAVPIVVSGHNHEVECLSTDGEKVVSSCLQGSIKVWDATSGDILTQIDRAAFFKLQKELTDKVNLKKTAAPLNNHEGSSPPDVTPKTDEVRRLSKGLSAHLSGLRFRPTRAAAALPPLEHTKYHFAKSYRELYCSEPQADDAENADTDQVFYFSSESEGLRNRSQPAPMQTDPYGEVTDVTEVTDSPIWCMDFCNDLIMLGCADGRLEVWDATNGKLLCVWHGCGGGVTAVRAAAGGRRAVLATLRGRLALLRLQAARPTRTAHKRTGSTGSLRSVDPTNKYIDPNEEVGVSRLAMCRAHQQPITELHVHGGRVLTGGQDHMLKVFCLSDLSPLLTLHGHCGPITSCFIDRGSTVAGSGSHDGTLAVWDLHTGACLYSVQAHDGAVWSLAHTASYVVSAGADGRLCVWDRFRGHLLSTMHVGLSYLSRMQPLTHSLLLLGDRGCLAVVDLSAGEVCRRVILGQTDGCIFVRQILPLKDAVVCDYGNQLRIVRFPLVSKLADVKHD